MTNSVPTEGIMHDFMNIVRALTDENRTRILMVLRGRELCVCQLTGFLDLSPSTTSKHLSILRQARLIENRRKGKWVYYSLADGVSAHPLVREAIAWVTHCLEGSSEILEDQRRIREILERENRLCPAADRERADDVFHSLEIHSLEDDDADAGQGVLPPSPAQKTLPEVEDEI